MPVGHSYAICWAHYIIWTGLAYMFGVKMCKLFKSLIEQAFKLMGTI